MDIAHAGSQVNAPNNATYTATDDCWAMVTTTFGTSGFRWYILKIDDFQIVANTFDNTSSGGSLTETVPLKKGQTLKITWSNANSCYYQVIPMLK